LEKGEALLRPDVRGCDIYEAVREEIVTAGYGQYSPDHVGHGIGLEDQEPPFFLPCSKDELEEGVVCAIEPSIFEPNTGGIRIEDNYIITRDGYEKISHYPIVFA
jgi:Xaa-Pro aminopeptidase